ncbi:MAG: hypothetical protein AAF405_01525, partial [Pseudomonadota bacterium]
LLIPAARLYQSLTQVLRLCLEGPFIAGDAPQALRDLLVRSAGMVDFAALATRLKDTLRHVHEAFGRLVR